MELFLIGRGKSCKRQAAMAAVISDFLHCGLDRNGIDLAEQRINQR